MLVRLSAYAALVLGLWGALSMLTVWGAGAGAALGVVALVCASAALSERPGGRTRRAALIGLVSGALAAVGFLVLILLAALGV